MSINTKTLYLWPEQASKIIKEKGLDVKELKRMFKFISFPWNNNYDFHRNYYSERIQQNPLFIIDVISIEEIESILNYVYENNLTIRICTGRHSTQLLSPDVLVDISKIDYIKIKDNILVVGGGATQGSANEYVFENLNKHNDSNCLHANFGHINYGSSSQFPGGSSASVGVSGISGCGGIGTLRRTFGLTIDSIISFKLTLPPTQNEKAKTIKVTTNSYTDLFWAICGGTANNFGIVSEIKYKLFQVNDIIKYSITWPFSQAKQVINLWEKNAPELSNQFTEDINLSVHKDINGIGLSGFYVLASGQSKKDAEKDIKNNLKYLGGELTLTYDTYSNTYLNLVKNRTYDNFSIIQAIFVDTIQTDLLIEAIQVAKSLINSEVSINIELLGGKIKEGDTGSFSFRNSKFFIDLTCKWNNLIDSQSNQKWINEYFEKIFNKSNGVYIGFPITFTNIQYTNKVYYPNSYKKLLKIKNKYDPEKILTYTGPL